MAPEPVHLLGGDELGKPPVQVRFVIGREHPIDPVDRQHVQRTVDDVGDAGPGGVEPWIVHRPGRIELSYLPTVELRQEQPPGE